MSMGSSVVLRGDPIACTAFQSQLFMYTPSRNIMTIIITYFDCVGTYRYLYICFRSFPFRLITPSHLI